MSETITIDRADLEAVVLLACLTEDREDAEQEALLRCAAAAGDGTVDLTAWARRTRASVHFVKVANT